MIDGSEPTAARVAVGSIYLTIRNILSTLIGVLGYALMARMITREEMGVIAGLSLLTSLIQLSSGFGLTSSLTKFISELRGRGGDPSEHVASALALRISVSLLLASALILVSTILSTILFKTAIYSDTIKLLAIDSVLVSTSSLLISVLWGHGRLKDMAVYGITSVAVRWFSITAFLTMGHGLNGVVYGWIAGDIVLLLALSTVTARLVNLKKGSTRRIPELLGFSWPIYLASAISFLYMWYDRGIVLAYLPLIDLGVYNIAYTAFAVLASIATSLGTALFPYYGMAYGKGDHKAIALGVRRASRYTMLVIFPLALGLAATSRPVITLFAGRQYELGWPILAILSTFGLVYGISPALSKLLLIYGRTKTILALSLVPVASSLTLLPLVWALGLRGLAVIRGASILLNFLLALYFISKIVIIEIDTAVMLKSLASSTFTALVVLALQTLLYRPILLPLYIIAGAIAYITAVRALKILDREDAQLIQQITGKTYSKYITQILGL